MKLTLLAAMTLITTQTFAHGVHPVLANYNKTIEAAYEHALHNVGYSESDFSNLAGVLTQQDTTRKIRVIKFKFTQPNCAKDIEIYAKLDGSAFLSSKVVGCAP